MTKIIIKIVFCVPFLLFIMASYLNAFQLEEQYNLVQLSNKSQSIVKGKVVSINYFKKENGYVYSDIEFEIIKNYKGPIEESKIIKFIQLGGISGDSKTVVLEFPQFTLNQESILFLNEDLRTSSNHYVVTEGAQGKFNISNNNSGNVVVRDHLVNKVIFIPDKGGSKTLTNEQGISEMLFINYLQSIINK